MPIKVDRRCFLALGLGLAAGTALSPLPWKLKDDAAVWIQNWPWAPVPKSGESTTVHSVCTLCPGGCGISVRKVGRRAVKIEGLSDYPVNRGSLCPLGYSGLQYLYGPSRITSPMKRIGRRGEGKWRKISWPEGLSMVRERLADLRAHGKPDTLACIVGSDRGTVPYLIDRFLTAYGSPNFIPDTSFLDTHELALYLTQGAQGNIGFDIENADFILSLGCSLFDGWVAPGRMFNILRESAKRRTLIQFEPRLSNTAARASMWIPIEPGTEGALALGIGHVIVRDWLYNFDFINNFSFGFEDWQDNTGKVHSGYRSLVLNQYSPQQTARITGIDAGRIESVARLFAKARRPIAVSGSGQGSVPGRINDCLAVHALNALVGNIGKPGGVIWTDEPDYLSWPEMEIDAIASAGRRRPRIDGGGSQHFPNTPYLLNRLPEVINAAPGNSPVQVLLVADANPLYTLPDTKAAAAALNRIPFIVSFSTFMDETAAHADLLLPHHHFLERYQDVPSPAGTAAAVIGLSRPVVSPQYDTRHIGDTFIAIAQSFGGFIKNAFPWPDYETFLKGTLGNKWDVLVKNGFWINDKIRPQQWFSAFRTPSGRFEFYPLFQDGNGKQQIPVPDFEPAPLEGDPAEFPLVLIPHDTIRIAAGPLAAAPFMMKTVDDTVLKRNVPLVEINPVTAAHIGLCQGDAAILQTAKGRVRVGIYLFDGIKPGLISMPRGLGHSAFSLYVAGKGTNINNLMGMTADPASGLNMAWGIRAALTKI